MNHLTEITILDQRPVYEALNGSGSVACEDLCVWFTLMEVVKKTFSNKLLKCNIFNIDSLFATLFFRLLKM